MVRKQHPDPDTGKDPKTIRGKIHGTIYETGEFEHWLNTQCQTGQLKKLVPLEEPTKFGSLIAERRKEIGMSVEQLSRLCLISPEQLKWIEAGVFNPDQNTLQWLANAIGVHRSNLLNGQIKLKPD